MEKMKLVMDVEEGAEDFGGQRGGGREFEEKGQRRHVRFPGHSILLSALCLSFFCAACLAVTWFNVTLYSDLNERIEILERGLTKCKNQPEEHEDVDDIGSQLMSAGISDIFKEDEMVRKFLPWGLNHQRQKRETQNGKRKEGEKKGNENRKKQPDGKRPPKKNRPPAAMSAIHLNLDVRAPTRDELQHNGEHAYIYKAWKVSGWAKDVKDYHFEPESGKIVIQQKGLYFIYSQILYHNSAARSSYVIMVDDDTFIKCMESVDAIMPDSSTSADSARYKTCYMGAARMLDKGQKVWIKDLYSRFVTTDPTSNFFGLIKIADLEN